MIASGVILSLLSSPSHVSAQGTSPDRLRTTSSISQRSMPRALFRDDQRHQERYAWARELSKWPRFCIQRRERSEDPFGGCLSRLDAMRAYIAIYRARRMDGFIEHTSLDLDPTMIDSWVSPEASQRLKVLERAALLDLCAEALYATGDIRWLSRALTLSMSSSWMRERSCTLGESCTEELISLLELTRLLSAAREPLTQMGYFDATSQDQFAALDQRRASWRSRGQQLTLPHPNGTLDTDRTRGGSASWWSRRARLAALTLNVTELTAWIRAEPLNASQLKPLTSLTKSQRGINLERALGLGSLAACTRALDALSDPEVEIFNRAFHEHARVSMESYLKHRRDYRGYGGRVPARGVIALTVDRAHRDLGLTFPPQRWLDPTQRRVFAEDLPIQGLKAEGMFSKIALRDQAGRRGLYFVRPNGDQLLETEVDLARPDTLQVRYTQDMLATYTLSATRPKRALLIGLGGGAMVHALHAYDPELLLDVIEIDPVVVDFARRYFGIKALEVSSTPASVTNLKNSSSSSDLTAPSNSAAQTQTQEGHPPRLRLFTEDGFAYLKRDLPHRYDMIWMDAFLQPTQETDSTGSPLNLKTRDFLKQVAAQHLTERGMIAININHHSGLRRDINTIRAAFPASTIWQVPQTGNYIAIGLRSPIKLSADTLRARASLLTDQQATPFGYHLMLERVLRGMQPPLP